MDVSDLLNAEPKPIRVEQVARAALFDGRRDDACPNYLSALHEALAEEPPPFGTRAYSDIYHDAASDGRWLAVSLITNAEREGDGATRLWSMAACSPDKHEQLRLKVHAVDESRHALFYLALLDFAFPGMTDPLFRRELRNLSPHYSMRMEPFPVPGSPYAKAPSIDDFVQMNIAEIRTTIHHLMQRPALSMHAPAQNKDGITPILDSLLCDELRHVAYTAKLIERHSQRAAQPDLRALVCKRLRDFNQITNEELGNLAFDCSVACCAKRPNCRAKALSVTAFIDMPI
ncbi:hypothetical protein [Rhizobium ruizarguesonis]|uniref:hypothetical protein n=1 Tax=Rhizobium ruizarguesonis TaxID=2081791 RepID=UPI0013DE9AD0|nr:hypothetical protein [Rhizobium ruizarguesonis]NEI79070.1 hypothetical protein [Rhizobium ruizarguesonis]